MASFIRTLPGHRPAPGETLTMPEPVHVLPRDPHNEALDANAARVALARQIRQREQGLLARLDEGEVRFVDFWFEPDPVKRVAREDTPDRVQVE